MNGPVLELGLILVLVLLNGVFASTEIALVTVRRSRLQQLAEDGNRTAGRVLRLKENPGRFLAVIQVGITFLGFLASAFAAVSLLIGARVENTESANGWMNFVQLPMWVMSGAFFSYERFPEWLHLPIRLMPLTALNDALRAIFNDGASLFACWSELLVMTVWGAVGFAVALRTFRWQ